MAQEVSDESWIYWDTKGMTVKQYDRLFQELSQIKGIKELHHGDCIGADEEAGAIASRQKIDVVIHPPITPQKRAYCKYFVRRLKKQSYLVRSRNIVDATDIMFATPKEMSEQLRSGTWAAVRYALKQHKRVVIIYPTGEVEERSQLK